MKWKCTFSPEEQEEAAADLAALRRHHSGAKVRRDKSKAPKLAVYLTVKSPKPVAAVRKSLDKTAPPGV